MKNYSLLVALFVLLVVSVGYAEETIESDGVVTVEAGIEVKPTLLKHYSPIIAGFGNIIPGLGYFLIDEPWWAVAEYSVMIGVGTLAGVIAAHSGDAFHANQRGLAVGLGTGLLIYSASLIHAPLLALHKYNQQKVALDLSPGLGLDSEGGAYPTVQLTLSF